MDVDKEMKEEYTADRTREDTGYERKEARPDAKKNRKNNRKASGNRSTPMFQDLHFIISVRFIFLGRRSITDFV
jgi:hypothetical protein